MMFEDLAIKLKNYGQEHLLKFVDELDEEDRNQLVTEIEAIDFEELQKLIEKYVKTDYQARVPEDISPAPYFPIEAENDEQQALYQKAKTRGRELLAQGRIAALTVAGGQGSRLGFDGPKGSYPVTPVKNKTLFCYFAESLIRAGKKFGSPIRWYIMTSTVNDQQTKDFFKENNFFGMDPGVVVFFSQGTMPAVSHDGQVLLKTKYSLALAPDGHGGTLLALRNSAALEDMKNHGVEHISYFQVDNPLVSVVNPLFVGLHDLEDSEISARALIKTGPFEKLGNFCKVDGALEIIEYSDMPDELAEARDEAGRLKFRAGSPAIHVIKREFVERLTEGGKLHLPWHRADKKVPYVNTDGNEVSPEEPNAVKLETFIFDAIPMAQKTMILEARREEEFGPVKNKTGVDSAESCREMLIDRDAAWLEAAGVQVPRNAQGKVDAKIELSPGRYFDAEDVKHELADKKPDIKPGEEIYLS